MKKTVSTEFCVVNGHGYVRVLVDGVVLPGCTLAIEEYCAHVGYVSYVWLYLRSQGYDPNDYEDNIVLDPAARDYAIRKGII